MNKVILMGRLVGTRRSDIHREKTVQRLRSILWQLIGDSKEKEIRERTSLAVFHLEKLVNLQRSIFEKESRLRYPEGFRPEAIPIKKEEKYIQRMWL